MGNKLCACWSNQDDTSTSANKENNLEASLSESLRQIKALDAEAIALGEKEKTLESEVDELSEQVDQETNPVIKTKLQLKIEEKNGELENAKCERNEAEDKSHDKLMKRSNKVVDSNQEEANKANVMNDAMRHATNLN